MSIHYKCLYFVLCFLIGRAALGADQFYLEPLNKKSNAKYEIREFLSQFALSRDLALNTDGVAQIETGNFLSLATSRKSQSRASQISEFSTELTNILDCGLQSKFYICFREDLKNILSDVDTEDFFLNLLYEMYQTIPNQRHFYLWEWTLKYYNYDVPKALKMIAVLFQDHRPLDEAVLVKNEMIKHYSTILQILISKDEDYRKYLHLYPKSVSEGKRAHYHFYTVGYLAIRLREKYGEHPLALVTPYVFNASYELYKKYGKSYSAFPKELSPDFNKFDIYLGYSAIQYFFNPLMMKSYAEFSQLAESDYREFMRQFYTDLSY